MRNCMLLVFFASAVHVATAPAQQCESHWSILDQYKTIPTDGITFCDGTDGAQTGGAQTNNGQPGGTSTSNEVLSVQPQSPAQSSSPASQIGASLGNNAPSLQSTDGSPAISITNDSCYGGNVEQVVSGKCKPGFRNTVFNPPAIHTPGWPNGPWDTIKQYNVTNFIAFYMEDDHGYPGPAMSREMACARIPLLMDPLDTPRAKSWADSQKPKYLGLFNEPDLNNAPGQTTPYTPANIIGENVEELMNDTNPNGLAPDGTIYLSPALVNNAQAAADYTKPGSWYYDFDNNCPGCMTNNISIISMHLYEQDKQKALGLITALASRYPTHKIWITEFSPRGGDPGCTYDSNGIKDWMRFMMFHLNNMPTVEKVFWNNGEVAEMDGCNVSLLQDDAQPTDLLVQFGSEDVCDDPGETVVPTSVQ